MTKSELIEIITAKQKHLPAKDVELALKQILEIMSDALSQGERIAHDLEDLFQRELDILGRQMLLLRGDDLDEFRLGHQLRSPICSLSSSPRLVPVGDCSER